MLAQRPRVALADDVAGVGVVALAEDDLVRLEAPRHGDPGDPLEVVRGERLEDGDARQERRWSPGRWPPCAGLYSAREWRRSARSRPRFPASCARRRGQQRRAAPSGSSDGEPTSATPAATSSTRSASSARRPGSTGRRPSGRPRRPSSAASVTRRFAYAARLSTRASAARSAPICGVDGAQRAPELAASVVRRRPRRAGAAATCARPRASSSGRWRDVRSEVMSWASCVRSRHVAELRRAG